MRVKYKYKSDITLSHTLDHHRHRRAAGVGRGTMARFSAITGVAPAPHAPAVTEREAAEYSGGYAQLQSQREPNNPLKAVVTTR